MDELENRLRRGLQHPSMSAEATEILADVHRGVRNRQQRRLAVGAAGVLAVLTATGVLTGTGTGPDGSRDLATSPTATPSGTSATTRPAAPDAGSVTGTLGFDATPEGPLWSLDLATCGHQPCSVLRRSDGGGRSDQVRVFALDPETPGAADLPPVEIVTAADDGQDLWVSGQVLWSSHDGGATWDEQPLPAGELPQRIDVAVVGETVFALQSSPSRLWRTSVVEDDWTEVALPDDVDRAEALTTLGDQLVVTAYAADRRVLLDLNASGGSWREAEAPCQGEVGTIRSTGSVLMAPCPGDGTFFDAPLVVWRSWDGATWKPFVGVNHTSYVDDVIPIDDDTAFVVTGEGGLIVTEDGQEPVALPLGKDDSSIEGEFVDAERGYLLVTSPPRLLATDDGGRTWTRLD